MQQEAKIVLSADDQASKVFVKMTDIMENYFEMTKNANKEIKTLFDTIGKGNTPNQVAGDSTSAPKSPRKSMFEDVENSNATSLFKKDFKRGAFKFDFNNIDLKKDSLIKHLGRGTIGGGRDYDSLKNMSASLQAHGLKLGSGVGRAAVGLMRLAPAAAAVTGAFILAKKGMDHYLQTLRDHSQRVISLANSGSVTSYNKDKYEKSILGKLTGALGLNGFIDFFNGWTKKIEQENQYRSLYQKHSESLLDIRNMGVRGDGKFGREWSEGNIKGYIDEIGQKYGYATMDMYPLVQKYQQKTGSLDVGSLDNIYKNARSFGMSPEGTVDLEAYKTLYDNSTADAIQEVGISLLRSGAGGGSNGVGRFQEYIDATMSVLSSGLEKGVTRSITGVAGTLGFLGQHGGKTWQGEAGARNLSMINNAFAGAVNLQSAGDMFKYKAFQQMTGKRDYWDVSMDMEKGIESPEMFQKFNKYLTDTVGNNKNNRRHRIKTLFGGLSNTQVVEFEALLTKLKDDKLDPNKRKEYEQQLSGLQKEGMESVDRQQLTELNKIRNSTETMAGLLSHSVLQSMGGSEKIIKENLKKTLKDLGITGYDDVVDTNYLAVFNMLNRNKYEAGISGDFKEKAIDDLELYRNTFVIQKEKKIEEKYNKITKDFDNIAKIYNREMKTDYYVNRNMFDPPEVTISKLQKGIDEMIQELKKLNVHSKEICENTGCIEMEHKY